jgi:SAM-dependent methyltransferase
MINEDPATVDGFGEEWSRFDNAGLPLSELSDIFDEYFRIFPWDGLPPAAEGFDAGCGSGRWARLVAPRVGRLHCVDASPEALDVAIQQLATYGNCTFHLASVSALPFAPGSMDFGYALGVLHHLPDPESGLRACAAALKPGAPLLVYLYYRFDNRPWWFRQLWKVSELLRGAVLALRPGLRFVAADVVAALIYFPLSRAARALEAMGADVDAIPLSYYRRRSFYVMRNDALDRLGTPLQHRFTRDDIRAMMHAAGLERVSFNANSPYWCAIGYRVREPGRVTARI